METIPSLRLFFTLFFKKETLTALKVTPITYEPPFSITDVRFEIDGGDSIVLDEVPPSIMEVIMETASYLIGNDILKYLEDCCKRIRRYIRIFNEGEAPLVDVDIDINGLKNVLITKILLYFQVFSKGEDQWHQNQLDALANLARDDKFMNTVYELRKDFERSFERAMPMNKRI
jgi:hypothetical protein